MTLSPSSESLVRGDEAARAQPVDLAAQRPRGKLSPVGPWVGEIRDQAQEEGFAQGRAEGHELGFREGYEHAELRQNELAAAIDSLLNQLEQRSSELSDRMATEAVDLALQIAEAVLGRELAVASDPGADAIARCLEIAPSTGDLVARLHPDDATRLGEVLGLADRQLTVVADPSLQPGDAVVTINDSTIDARLAEALRRVGEVLA